MCTSLRFFISKVYCHEVLTREEQRIDKFCFRTANGEHINWMYFRIQKIFQVVYVLSGFQIIKYVAVST